LACFCGLSLDGDGVRGGLLGCAVVLLGLSTTLVMVLAHSPGSSLCKRSFLRGTGFSNDSIFILPSNTVCAWVLHSSVYQMSKSGRSDNLRTRMCRPTVGLFEYVKVDLGDGTAKE